MQNFMLFNPSLKYGVVCHDAGAANIILSWLKGTNQKNFKALVCGPAEKLWQEYFPDVETYQNIEDVLEGSVTLITGTGWGSDLEHNARRLAKQKNIHTVAVIDHWVNYAERFTFNDESIMPNEYWVSDSYAEAEAKKHFEWNRIKLIENYYLRSQLEMISLVQLSKIPECLYILEPIRDDWGRKGQGEFQALDYFIKNKSKIGITKDCILKLRPHPSEPKDKYYDWVENNQIHMSIIIDDSLALADSIGRASWVVGCESYALTISIAANKLVYSTLPPWGNKCRLPHKELVLIKDV